MNQTQANQPGRQQRASDALSDYLVVHLIGATSGVRLFQAAAQSWEGTVHGKTLGQLGEEISTEREELIRLIRSLGFAPNKPKMLAAHVSAGISRVNPINLLRSRSGEAAQLELETLQSAVRAKECLWDTLLAIAPNDAQLDEDRMRVLRDRAREQQNKIAHVMTATANDRFKPYTG